MRPTRIVHRYWGDTICMYCLTSVCNHTVAREVHWLIFLLFPKATYTGSWINKFTCEGKGPVHPRFFWVDPVTMRVSVTWHDRVVTWHQLVLQTNQSHDHDIIVTVKVFWSKSLEDRYIPSKETKSGWLNNNVYNYNDYGRFGLVITLNSFLALTSSFLASILVSLSLFLTTRCVGRGKVFC